MAAGEIIRFTAAFFPRWRANLVERYLRTFELPLDRKVKGLSRGMRASSRCSWRCAARPRRADRSTARGTIYPDEMPGNTPDGRHCCVDTVGLALHVSVLAAHDDPLVGGIATMEPDEVAAVQCQDGPAMGPGES